jgi:hypothetical protein
MHSSALPVGRSALAGFPGLVVVQKLAQRVAQALPPLVVETLPHVAVSTHLQQTTNGACVNTSHSDGSSGVTSMQLSPSWQANSCLATPEISQYLIDPDV